MFTVRYICQRIGKESKSPIKESPRPSEKGSENIGKNNESKCIILQVSIMPCFYSVSRFIHFNIFPKEICRDFSLLWKLKCKTHISWSHMTETRSLPKKKFKSQLFLHLCPKSSLKETPLKTEKLWSFILSYKENAFKHRVLLKYHWFWPWICWLAHSLNSRLENWKSLKILKQLLPSSNRITKSIVNATVTWEKRKRFYWCWQRNPPSA